MHSSRTSQWGKKGTGIISYVSEVFPSLSSFVKYIRPYRSGSFHVYQNQILQVKGKGVLDETLLKSTTYQHKRVKMKSYCARAHSCTEALDEWLFGIKDTLVWASLRPWPQKGRVSFFLLYSCLWYILNKGWTKSREHHSSTVRYCCSFVDVVTEVQLHPMWEQRKRGKRGFCYKVTPFLWRPFPVKRTCKAIHYFIHYQR